MAELIADNRIYFGTSGNNVPRFKRFITDVQDGFVPLTLWFRDEVGDNQEAKKEVKSFNPDDVFSTPKPERLLERCVLLATVPGDLVLDSFLGSATTAAVAHKMGRRWIGIELGEHAYTHCKTRLDMVIDGDQGGISAAVNWQGGGGYTFYELAPSLLERHPILPVYQINREYTFEMLCEAICKLEGFTYMLEGEMHGHSSESRFIHVTRDFISGDYITKIMKEVGEDQSVLIYGVKIQSGLRLPDNVEVKKIPKDLLKKCDFESEVR
jgi:adenine-specific DNA-methyltransferase